MTLATEDHLDDLLVMREESLRCLEVARGHGDEPALVTWENCLNRIEAMITRQRTGEFA